MDKRSCAGCTLCCSLLSVAELDKPPMVRCVNCAASGCRIYAQRPTECRQFYCGYLLKEQLDQRWKPSQCKLIVVFDEHPYCVAIHVDPAFPDAWRKEPFYSQICRWARTAARRHAQVVVWQGDSKIIVPAEQHPPLPAGASPCMDESW